MAQDGFHHGGVRVHLDFFARLRVAVDGLGFAGTEHVAGFQRPVLGAVELFFLPLLEWAAGDARHKGQELHHHLGLVIRPIRLIYHAQQAVTFFVRKTHIPDTGDRRRMIPTRSVSRNLPESDLEILVSAPV